MSKIKISAVSYTNTFPFIYGIENTDLINHIELSKDIPSVCAQKLLNNEVDLGLIPVAVIPKLEQAEIISDFCIGASGPVRSVILVSYKPLDKVDTILLDYHSRSSVLLTRILAKKFWKIDVKWANTTEGFETKVKENEGAVVIGDKALAIEKNFPYVYDLAEEWIKNTGLQFVFAAWVSRRKLGDTFNKAFNNSLQYGINHIEEMINTYDFSFLPHHVNIKEYFKKNIDYILGQEKRKALDLFHKYAREIQ